MAALGKNLKYKIFIKNLSLCVNFAFEFRRELSQVGRHQLRRGLDQAVRRGCLCHGPLGRTEALQGRDSVTKVSGRSEGQGVDSEVTQRLAIAGNPSHL